MPNERGSEYKPTFVYRRKEMKPKGGGKTKEKLPPMPLATDLHIRFTKGGVTVTDIGGAERSDRKTAKGDEVTLTFPPSKMIKAGDSVGDPPKSKKGDDAPQAPEPPAESSCKPTFKHADPDFPPIDEWWWTHKRSDGKGGWENYEGPHHRGNPTEWEHE